MSNMQTSASAYFQRPDLSGSVAQAATVAATAAMTAAVWLSAAGFGDAPRGYAAAAAASDPARVARTYVTLPPVKVVGRRTAVDDGRGLANAGQIVSEAAGCERPAHKPG